MHMEKEIAKVLNRQEGEIRMKPIGFCQVGNDRLYFIGSVHGECEGRNGDGSDIVRDIMSANGYDYATHKQETEVLRSISMIPFTHEGKGWVLIDMPLSHLDEYGEHEK